MEKKISKNQKMYPHHFGCTEMRYKFISMKKIENYEFVSNLCVFFCVLRNYIWGYKYIRYTFGSANSVSFGVVVVVVVLVVVVVVVASVGFWT